MAGGSNGNTAFGATAMRFLFAGSLGAGELTPRGSDSFRRIAAKPTILGLFRRVGHSPGACGCPLGGALGRSRAPRPKPPLPECQHGNCKTDVRECRRFGDD